MRRRRTSREVNLNKGQPTAAALPATPRQLPPIWPQGCTWEQACQWWASVWADKERQALVRRAPVPRVSPTVMGGTRTIFIRHPYVERKKNLKVGTVGPSPTAPLSAVYGPSCSAASIFRTENEAARCLGESASINIEATQNV